MRKLSARDYQKEAVQAIWNYFMKFFGNPIVAMPTGTGKSVVIALFLMSIYRAFPNQKVLVVTHVQELIQQNFDKLMAWWPQAPAGIYSAGLNRKDILNRIVFAGIASIVKAWASFGWVDLIIIDECHLVSPNDKTMYRKLIDSLKKINPNLKVIGLTATKFRLGQGELTEEDGLFTDVCFDITDYESFNRLISEGYLIPLTSRRTQTYMDLEGIHIRGGEFIESELVDMMTKEKITERALAECLQYKDSRRKWLIFSTGVAHAHTIVEILETMGITARAVYSGMPKKGPGSREEALHLHRIGKVQVLVNNNILTTGYDDPEIDLIVVLRATASPGLWVQMLGRGTRPLYEDGFDLETTIGRLSAIMASAKQDCLILDFARNAKRLGPINDPVIPKRKGKGGGMAPVKECEKCGCENHASVRFCTARPEFPKDAPMCGHPFTFEVKFMDKTSDEEVVRGDLPIVQVFKVDHITYSLHVNGDKPPMMKVTHYCGVKSFTDFVCVQHTNYARRKAVEWMKLRMDGAPFDTTEEALLSTRLFATPTHIRVWVNKPGGYPEIKACCFDGSEFGAREPTQMEPPTIDTINVQRASPRVYSHDTNPDLDEIMAIPPNPVLEWGDDDIPF